MFTLPLLLTLIGGPVPEWQGEPPGLEGKVVLIRFFTDTSCPYCAKSAPALNALHSEFGERGLVVVGIFTPKPSPRPVLASEVEAAVKAYGFEFPVVIDERWKALRALWLDRVPGAAYTSASLLVDRRGIVRHVHEGGAYSRADVRALRSAVAQLVSEP